MLKDLTTALDEIGLHLNKKKCQYVGRPINPRMSQEAETLPAEDRAREGIAVLGRIICGGNVDDDDDDDDDADDDDDDDDDDDELAVAAKIAKKLGRLPSLQTSFKKWCPPQENFRSSKPVSFRPLSGSLGHGVDDLTLIERLPKGEIIMHQSGSIEHFQKSNECSKDE